MAKIQEKYELMIVINPNLGEEGVGETFEKFKALIEANGTLEEVDDMGKRRLAYEINYIADGHYYLVKFTSAPEFPKELDRVIGITDGVLRSLITVRPE
ncbi:MAG: 30S ribosomal protein S6 [Oscillospiraceae bacterium]|nr:30S ribosomal protein S6 [Oscillospiraceae bacterium]